MAESQRTEEQLILVTDSEGYPVQELAAICYDLTSNSVKDVFLNWAKLPYKDNDWFARKHIHGLSPDFLQAHGLENEAALVADFHTWRQKYVINEIFAHAPHKEEVLLNLRITDVALCPWAERRKDFDFKRTLVFKILNIPIHGTTCYLEHAHKAYEGWRHTRKGSLGDIARQEYGHHCALYDCVYILLHKFPQSCHNLIQALEE